ncbi:MAG: hypothetical protein J0L77_09645 [Alphaproteobacteria bacterium]|nr:hypothetical protein [Alphaproteobacteria bacterium]
MKFLILICLGLLILPGCQTLSGAKNDIARIIAPDTPGQASAVAGDPPIEADGIETACPPVRVMDDLKQAVEFVDLSRPSDASEMGRLTITKIDTRCVNENDATGVDITFEFDGKLGPKGRWKAGDEASFAYPYFVAVTDAQGVVLSKELFAASVSYNATENALRQVETIRQSIPNTTTKNAIYNIVVGFQLSEEQLAYNRRQMASAQKP